MLNAVHELRELWMQLEECQLVLEGQGLAAQDRVPRMHYVLGAIVQRMGEIVDSLEGPGASQNAH